MASDSQSGDDEREALRQQLQASEARWRAIIDSAVDGIIIIDTRGRIESFNLGAERMFGYAEREVQGVNVSVLMPAPYRDEHDGYIERYLRTSEPHIIGIGREVQGLRRDGSTFPVHLSVGQLTVNGERKFTGILHDLSARVRMEEQLRERTALARLGEMAALLAHEVKNPLAGIRGAIQVIGARLPQDNPSAPVIKEIVARIDSLDEMMKDLLLFARPPQPHRQMLDLTRVIQSTVNLLRQDPAIARLDMTVSGAAPPVPIDADMLKIIVQNLVINSAHAMPEHGRIDIVVSATDDACAITFRDNGPGIPADVLQKVFTPFFTTKSRGSGLGLTTVKRLAEAHGGEVTIDAPLGRGTAVTVTMPLG
ncbi:MAG: PAS domain S-box protein [Acidobacteria bacterium]|nr:PAS domain S-box protein [Acidobacteriota bacterium]